MPDSDYHPEAVQRDVFIPGKHHDPNRCKKLSDISNLTRVPRMRKVFMGESGGTACGMLIHRGVHLAMDLLSLSRPRIATQSNLYAGQDMSSINRRDRAARCATSRLELGDA
jgi:hypothetical protein